ncbi:fibrobacter succinogenes major paralogous domain-containing protein [Flavobacterium sp. N1994]|uniref:fibrobacter succinogenes major paralogous domain-containing protein n=1 Tax=Flavobacterium sp. N1994 TaxID=2986827 RepID=UPI0022223AFC|nr:fibrobacter succinogenes major paralogous domain-containing protein [Flavobacterium sp. N1994]
MKVISTLAAFSLLLLLTACPDDTDTIETVKIGQQTWMKKNLAVEKYRNGDAIPQVTDPNQWLTLTTGAWCYYNNDANNDKVYGKLYNWYAVNDPRGLAPEGWHVPSKEEWTTLADYLGGAPVAGAALKETGTTHWLAPNAGATNSTGFTGVPGGYRNDTFANLGFYSFYWSTTPNADNPQRCWNTALFSQTTYLGSGTNDKMLGISVRCVKD